VHSGEAVGVADGVGIAGSQYGVGDGEGSCASTLPILREHSTIRPCISSIWSRFVSWSVKSEKRSVTFAVSQMPGMGLTACDRDEAPGERDCPECPGEAFGPLFFAALLGGTAS
jgi:hypothetical protein